MKEEVIMCTLQSNANTLASFNGILDGKSSMLYGLNVSPSGGGGAYGGIIRANYGKISGLNIVGNTVNSIASGDLATGILTGYNTGIIENIKFFDNDLVGYDQVGLVAGKNSKASLYGVIDSIIIGYNNIKGRTNVGSVAGLNDTNSSIKRILSSSLVENKSGEPNFSNIGGVVGNNNGVVDQVEFDGDILFAVSSGVDVNTGGIVGFNDTAGTVSNTFTTNYSEIIVANTQRIGGLVGSNSGSVNKSFALGQVVYDNAGGMATPANPFHSLIGFPTSSTAVDSFYLQNQIGSLFEAVSGLTCSGTNPNYIYNVPPSKPYLVNATPATNADRLSFDFGPGGNTLDSMVPMTVPADDTVNFTNSFCNSTGFVYFYRSYILSNTVGQLTPAGFTNIATFANYDIALSDHATPANSTNQDRLMDYYKSVMNKTAPTLTPPIWELEVGEPHPRLVQIRDDH